MSPRCSAAVVLALACWGGVRPLAAQPAAGSMEEREVVDGLGGAQGRRALDEQEAEAGRGWLEVVVGRSPDRDRIIGGLWAMHPFEPQFPELDWTRGLGGLYGHWFGATFVNSYDERTFILGIERSWFSVRSGVFGVGAGYRVGLITGYDERLIEIARHTPVLPFGGVLVWSQAGPVTLDLYYVYRAITLEAGVAF